MTIVEDLRIRLEDQGMALPARIIKRNGAYVDFDVSRIQRAVKMCYESLEQPPATPIEDIVSAVANTVASRWSDGGVPTVEAVQDLVETALLSAGEFPAARHYIVYREAHAKQRVIIPEEVVKVFAEDEQFFPTELQRFMFYDKYSRYNWEKKRRETWRETVDRVVDYLWHLGGDLISSADYRRIHSAILSMRVMPSMRLLAQAGPAAIRNSMSIYNCSHLPVRDIAAFSEAMLVSMAGCGVGFSVERENVEQFPRIKRQTGVKRPTFVIPDTTEGWAQAVQVGAEAWFAGEDIDFDYSEVRLAGTPLLTKGGRASGPEPLKFVVDFTRQKILSRQGSFLRTIDAHDIMCVVGGAAVSGGVRRTAMISIFDFDDQEMRTCKTGAALDANPWRWNANNSAVWPEEITTLQLVDQMTEMARSQRGEPGIFSRANAVRTKPARRKAKRFGPNPCVVGDTLIATVDGPRTIKDLADKGDDVKVYAWDPLTKRPVVRFMRAPRLTRENEPLVEVVLDSGLKVKCTPDHSFYSFRGKKVQAQFLQVGQSVRAWSMSEHRDGHLRVHGWDAQENKAVHQWLARMVWEETNGLVPDGFVVHHRDEDKENNDIENLECVSIPSHLSHHYPARFENGFDGRASNHKVVAVVEAGSGDVYNGTVDEVHTYIILDPTPVAGVASGIVSANCGEIDLDEYQFCNLSIAVARPDDTEASLGEKVRIAALIGTIQATATTFPSLRPEWKKHCEEERLLGVDISGQQDCPAIVGDTEGLMLERLRMMAVSTNRYYAQMLGITAATAVTCNKPNGNSSLLLDCASGIHVRWAPYYIRNCRVSAATPLYRVLRDAGVPMDPENGQTTANATTWVVHFPVKAPAGAKTRKGYRALDQCAYWLRNKIHWAEHNPSVTITYEDHELLETMSWVWEHRDVIGGMAFLPADNAQYQQLPYIEISKEEYERLAAAFPPVDYSRLFAHEATDMTEAAQTLACSASKGEC